MKQVITTEKFPIKMWLDDIEPGAMAQARNLANLPFVAGWVALMPDCHEGYGMPIGGVLATRHVIIPNAVGVDIGCGMLATQHFAKNGVAHELFTEDVLKRVMARIREEVPMGFNHHRHPVAWDGFDTVPADAPVVLRELESARKQIGTLGGGNHFIELLRREQKEGSNDTELWAMVHSGSRNLGLKVASHYHEKAQMLCSRWHIELPHSDLAYLPAAEPLAHEYRVSMDFCRRFAEQNRQIIMDRISEAIADEVGLLPEQSIESVHNYVALEMHLNEMVWVHRKGAIRASEDTLGVIPGSMGSPSFIVLGCGNPNSFESASHGAGRRMGRGQARRTLKLEEEQARMAGIVHGLRNTSDLDEAPGAYKNILDVMTNQQDLVSVEAILSPIANLKG